MTVVNPKSISGINSITTGSGSDDILTIHNNNGTERLRVDSTGATKITTGIVTTLTATTGIVTTLTTNTLTANSTAKVGSGITLSPDGDVFATGVCTATSFVGSGANLTGISGVSVASQADNRLITCTGTSDALTGESNLSFSSNTLTVHEASLKGNQLLFNTSGTVYIDHSTTGQDIQFRTSVSSSQDTTGPTIKSTGNIAFASGKGIDFSATSGTGTSELFDDYEEGTFTPEWNAGSAASACYAGGVSYSSQVGVYRKVGHVVHFIIKLQVSSGTTKSGQLILLGLPFTSGNFSSYSAAGGAFVSYTTGYFSDTAHIPTAFVSPGQSYLNFFNTAGNNFAGSHLAQAAGRIDINGHYFTS